MKHRLNILGETILVNNVVYCSRVSQEGDKWFFNAVHVGGVAISIIGKTKEEVETARELLLSAKIANDKKHFKNLLRAKNEKR